MLTQIAVFFFLGTVTVQAQNFKPFRSLRTIKTEYFDIIFPAESERTAHTLADFADETYEKISGLLGINLRKRIPVVITPDTEQFNGYMNPMTSPHIVLFDTPMDLEWTNFENTLHSLFLHELTHVFSISSTAPVYDTLNRIFGGWVLPAILNASQFMAEGVTVSFESLNGFGRANDPLIKEEIRQAIYEKKTLTPFQLSGTYDLPAGRSSFYEYGGLFSAYIQKKYGMEKYAELWQLMGREHYFSFSVYKSGIYRLFQNVYGIPFMDTWTDFLNFLSLDNIAENNLRIPFRSKTPFINVLASSADAVYFGDQLDQELLRYNSHTGTVEKVMDMDSSVFDISLSPDGEKLLFSSYRYKGELASAVVTEYTIDNAWRTGRRWEHIARGQYFRDGIIGIGSDLHNSTIIYKASAEHEEVLLPGNEEIVYTTVHAINETWIIYVRALNGVRELCMFNYETKKEYVLKSNLEDDSLRWKYIRNLRVSHGKVLFVYNHDDRMYKLGVIDMSQFNNEDSVMNAVFSSIDFSGGVFLPALVNDDIFYRGFFAEEDRLMRFPETIHTLSGAKAEIRLTVNGEDFSVNLPYENNAAETENIYNSKNYFSLGWMNPFKFWIPFLPLFRTTEKFISLDGWGFTSLMIDPTDTNTIQLSAIGDWKAKMADVTIDWNTLFFGFPLTLSFEDGVDSMLDGESYRATQASISGSFTRSIGNERNYAGFLGGVLFSVYADNPFDNSSAYIWSYEDPQFSAVLGTGWSNLYRYPWQLFGTGLSADIYYRTPFDFSQTRIDGTFSIAMEKVFPLRFQFYAAYDTDGMNMHGNGRYFGSYFQDIASTEYPSSGGLNNEWISGGEIELRLFGIEIQKNLSHLYFNRIYSTLAYRTVVYDSQGWTNAEGTRIHQDILAAQSLILRLGIDCTLPIGMAVIPFNPSVWGAWKISNMNDGEANDFHFNVGFEVSL